MQKISTQSAMLLFILTRGLGVTSLDWLLARRFLPRSAEKYRAKPHVLAFCET